MCAYDTHFCSQVQSSLTENCSNTTSNFRKTKARSGKLRRRRIHCNQEIGRSNCQLWSYCAQQWAYWIQQKIFIRRWFTSKCPRVNLYSTVKGVQALEGARRHRVSLSKEVRGEGSQRCMQYQLTESGSEGPFLPPFLPFLPAYLAS